MILTLNHIQFSHQEILNFFLKLSTLNSYRLSGDPSLSFGSSYLVLSPLPPFYSLWYEEHLTWSPMVQTAPNQSSYPLQYRFELQINLWLSIGLDRTTNHTDQVPYRVEHTPSYWIFMDRCSTARSCERHAKSHWT